jgi:hypothetical protein
MPMPIKKHKKGFFWCWMLEFNIFEMNIGKGNYHIFKPLKSPLVVLILTKILKMEDFHEFFENWLDYLG